MRRWFKRIIVLSCALFSFVGMGAPLLAFTVPGAPTGYVSDFAGVFSADEKYALQAGLRGHEQSTTQEIAVVTVPSLGDEAIETYAVQLFAAWGIGKRWKDNGVLILLAKNDRRVRIEVGYGLEESLTDAKSARIIARAKPFFQEERYARGLTQMTEDVQAVLTGHSNGADIGAMVDDDIFDTIWFFVFIAMFSVVPVIIFIGWMIHVVGRVLRQGKIYKPYVDGPTGGWIPTSHSSHSSHASSSSSDSSSSSSSSSDSFGGGSSGGGGASGGW